MEWKKENTVFDLDWTRHDGVYCKQGVTVRRNNNQWIVEGIGAKPQAFSKRRKAFMWAEAVLQHLGSKK